MQEVELPDGTIIEFPDNASAGFISTVIRRHSTPGKILHSIMNPDSIRRFKQPVAEVVSDVIPGISHKRSLNRIEESLSGIGGRTPIGKVLSGADVALEGVGMAADFVPGLKAAALAAGSLLPLMSRSVSGARRFGRQSGMIGSADDLPMDKASKLKRAEDIGMRTNMPLFHGGGRDIQEFDLTKGGEVSGSPVGRLGVSVSTDRETAEEFAGRVASGDGEVREFLHRAERPVSVELDGTEGNFEIAATVERAWEQGFDAIKFNNYTTPEGKTGKSFILVRDPSQLRDINAKFDPAKKTSANLLAGGAAGAVGVNLALDDEEQNFR